MRDKRNRLKPRSDNLAVWAAAGANIAIASTKFVAAYFTGSTAMLAEGIHSTVDTGNEFFLLVGKKRSQHPADAAHPFGYGQEIYFWTLLVGVTIFALGGALSFYEGVRHVLSPEPIERPIWSFLVLAFSLLFEGSSFFVGAREYSKHRPLKSIFRGLKGSDDPAVFAVVIEDSAAITGLLIALTGVTLTVVTGNPVYDASASILIGTMLMLVAVFMIRETRGLLIGAGLEPQQVDEIRRVLASDPYVGSISKILTSHLAPNEVVMVVDLRFKNVKTAQDMRAAVSRVVESVKRLNPAVKSVYLEAHSVLD